MHFALYEAVEEANEENSDALIKTVDILVRSFVRRYPSFFFCQHLQRQNDKTCKPCKYNCNASQKPQKLGILLKIHLKIHFIDFHVGNFHWFIFNVSDKKLAMCGVVDSPTLKGLTSGS